MSDKPKWDSDEAVPVARELIELLKPYCERIEIAGSLRRQKERVGDIELLFIPRFEDRQEDMFTTAPVNLADEKIGQLLRDGVLNKRPSVTGVYTWGSENKLALHVVSGIPVDLFSTDSERWWVALVIRTGSKETNISLTTGAQKRGARLNAYGSGVTWSDGTQTRAESERHVFELCGVEYNEPNER